MFDLHREFSQNLFLSLKDKKYIDFSLLKLEEILDSFCDTFMRNRFWACIEIEKQAQLYYDSHKDEMEKAYPLQEMALKDLYIQYIKRIDGTQMGLFYATTSLRIIYKDFIEFLFDCENIEEVYADNKTLALFFDSFIKEFNPF